jgi:HSP20 family protein
MWSYEADLDAGWNFLEEFRRRMDNVMDELDPGRSPAWHRGSVPAWPAASLKDEGALLIVRAEVPGLGEKDVAITLNQDVLTLKGARPADVPSGFSVHRQERPSVTFARSFALPCKVDAEKAAAVVKDGVLTVTLPKTPDSQPRQIAVRTA